MTASRQILFIQGAGEGTHAEWDNKLVDSLSAALGDGYEIRYPRMPGEDEPSTATWVPAIRQEIAKLDPGAVVVGHSVGGTILVHALVEEPPAVTLRAIVLIAAPFVGSGGWPADEFELSSDLGDRLPAGVAVHVFHGIDDDTVPPAHADLYAGAIPRAEVHRVPGRDHQLNDDLEVVADIVRPLMEGP